MKINIIKELIPLEFYFYPDHDPINYQHWARYVLQLYEGGYQTVSFENEVLCAGYELEVNMSLINKIQYWGYGKQFSSKKEMEKACKNRAFW